MAFVVYGAALLSASLLAIGPLLARPEPAPAGTLRVRGIVDWALVGVAAASVLSPYMGLKTRTALTMFSNLRTEGYRSNHFFMPQWYLTDLPNDVVEIVETSDLQLQAWADVGKRVPWFEVVRATSRNPEGSLRYIRDGRERSVARVGDEPDLATPSPWLLRKLLIFRPVSIDGPPPCDW